MGYKKHIEALQLSESKYRAFFESTVDAVFLMQDKYFIDCNKSALEMFGCSRKDQIVGHTPIEFSPSRQPDGRPSSEKAMGMINKALSGKQHHFYWLHTRLDRSTFHTEVTLSPVKIRIKL